MSMAPMISGRSLDAGITGSTEPTSTARDHPVPSRDSGVVVVKGTIEGQPAVVLAIGGKFVLRIRGKHVFNPTNFGIVLALGRLEGGERLVELAAGHRQEPHRVVDEQLRTGIALRADGATRLLEGGLGLGEPPEIEEHHRVRRERCRGHWILRPPVVAGDRDRPGTSRRIWYEGCGEAGERRSGRRHCRCGPGSSRQGRNGS